MYQLCFTWTVLSKTQPKLIGSVCSDSGTLSIVDTCLVKAYRPGKVKFPKRNLYTSFETEIGDGDFPVYEVRDSKGKLKCIVISLE
jgi:hypothetical protein